VRPNAGSFFLVSQAPCFSLILRGMEALRQQQNISKGAPVTLFSFRSSSGTIFFRSSSSLSFFSTKTKSDDDAPLLSAFSLFFYRLLLLVLSRSLLASSLARLPSSETQARQNERAMPPLDKYPLERGTTRIEYLDARFSADKLCKMDSSSVSFSPPSLALPLRLRHLSNQSPSQRSSRPFWLTISTLRRISSST
jgi:hypothetical protein